MKPKPMDLKFIDKFLAELDTKFVVTKDACDSYEMTPQTIRNLEKNGKVESVQIPLMKNARFYWREYFTKSKPKKMNAALVEKFEIEFNKKFIKAEAYRKEVGLSETYLYKVLKRNTDIECIKFFGSYYIWRDSIPKDKPQFVKGYPEHSIIEYNF